MLVSLVPAMQKHQAEIIWWPFLSFRFTAIQRDFVRLVVWGAVTLKYKKQYLFKVWIHKWILVLRIHYSNKNMLFDFYSAQFSPCRTFFSAKYMQIYFPEKELTTFKYHLFSCVLWFAKYLQRHELQAFFDSHFQVLLFALLRRLKYPFVIQT